MSLACDLCKQSRAISRTWWWTKRTIGCESRKLPLATYLFSLIKCVRRSSIWSVAFGKRSLYKIFIIAISLSTSGDRLGLDKLRDRGLRCIGDWRPPALSKSLSDVGVSPPLFPDDTEPTSDIECGWCWLWWCCDNWFWCFNSFDWCCWVK